MIKDNATLLEKELAKAGIKKCEIVIRNTSNEGQYSLEVRLGSESIGTFGCTESLLADPKYRNLIIMQIQHNLDGDLASIFGVGGST